ncbi:MAG: peptide-methionine (S)-S-oxide reductase [Synergistaceae bacterium]|jgi:peptide methionine sulfoxide reductase MsrA|nr:peptide-methionine (S)-S-oxide reductase [Synergistaceae bacterium]
MGYLRREDYVHKPLLGYANGDTENPTYEEVCDDAGHAETVEVIYVAEEYHQDYLEKNPGGYCHVDFGKLERPGAKENER